MKDEIFKLFWEMSKSAYPSGKSNHTNTIIEQDYEELIDKIVLIKTKNDLSENAPECSNCHNKMKLHGIAYDCKCGIVSVV
jgi:tRNA(Ile2) C34 agmatinyltransferase TiaS